MNHRLLLVNAPPVSVAEPWYDTPAFVRTALACLAAYVQQHTNWQVKCLDAKFEQKTFADTAREIAEYEPTLVGFTAFTNEIKPSAYLAGLVKQLNPAITTVCGGVHLTALPAETLQEFPTFDIGVVGEGEQTLAELCLAFENGTPLQQVQGLVYRPAPGKIALTEPRNRILNLENLPMPAWHLLPPAAEYYIQTERGCPFACHFCMNPNGKVARKRSVPQVIAEMEYLIENAKAKRISFGDELFSVDMPRTNALLDAMIEHRIGQRVSWDIQTHVAFVNEPMLRKMKQANLAKIEMGVETGDPQILKRMGKGINPQMIAQAFKNAREAGLKTGSFFIIGQPGETRKSIISTIRLAVKLNPTEPIFGTMVPYPGTEVARMAAQNQSGYQLLTTNWDNYSKQLSGSLSVNGMSPASLKRWQIVAYVMVFLANFRWLEFAAFLWSYRTAALEIVKLAFKPGTTPDGQHNLPAGYEQIIASRITVTPEQIIQSRINWKNTQSTETRLAQQNMPQLLLQQMPV